jgi:hypothetical protein
MSEDFEDGYDGLPDEEIKSCPFCGAVIILENISVDADYEILQATGHKDDCYLYDEKMCEVWESKEDFCEQWNRRA